MEYIEVTGRTIDDALTNACLKLETTSDNIEYEVIEKGSAGFLGMGRKLAVLKKEATVYSVFLIQSQQRLRQELRLV